ncbi:MAG: hypothetical protein NZ828_11995 [Alphaproteobacteria bacterium]|jgi:DNA repair exonuclease SbcCD ATPase subunit|nr:hypothetical protein [Alphaproteobacteria bacterium]
MSDNLDLDALFGNATDTAENTAVSQDAFEQQEANLADFGQKYEAAEEGLASNPIYQIISSDKTGAEKQQALIDFVKVNIGEDSKAVVQELANIVEQYAQLSSITSSAVRDANNLDQAEVFNTTLQTIHQHQSDYSELSEMYNKAIVALMAAQQQGRGIKDIISETKAKRKKANELKAAMISQTEAVEEAQGEYDAQIEKQKKLQKEVEEAQAEKDKYTKGCEEVKDEQTGEVLQKKLQPLATLEQAYAAESGGWAFFGNKKKDALGKAIAEYKKKIKAADDVVDDLNPQVRNLEGPISRSKEALEAAQAELTAQETEYNAIEEELANDDTVKAVEELIGNGDNTHFTEQAKKFGDAGKQLVNLMESELAKCIDFYGVQQENQTKLLNTSTNLSSELKSIVAGLRKGLFAHEKDYKALSEELTAALEKIESDKAAELEKANEIEAEDERLEAIDNIEKEYIDLPPHVKQMQEDQREYESFLRDYSSRLEQISTFEEQITVSLAQTTQTHQTAVNLTHKTESLKNNQVTMVNAGTSNATATVSQLLQEININMMAEFGQAASKTNAMIAKTGTYASIHREKMSNKDRAESIKTLTDLSKTMDAAKAQLVEEAKKTAALQKLGTQATDQFEKSAQELVNTSRNSKNEARQKMQEDEAYAKQAVQSTASYFQGPKPKEPGQ